MTKQEAIDQAWSLLELLESLPDGVDIVNAQIENPLRGIVFPLKIHLDSGVEPVAIAFSSPIKTRIPNEFIYREVYTQNCKFVQLESAASIIKAALGDDNTEGGGTDGESI